MKVDFIPNDIAHKNYITCSDFDQVLCYLTNQPLNMKARFSTDPKMLIFSRIILIAIFCISAFSLHAQLRVGDPGVTFDQNKMDPRYPQMEKWILAGVRGGIPFLEDQIIKVTLNNGADSDDIIQAVNKVAGEGGGAILLKNGNYRIDKMISMRSNVSIIGESREGTILTVYMTGQSAFYFGEGDKNAGIYRLTIQGSWGTPKYDWNISSDLNDELPGNDNILVKFTRAEDCWLDQVNLINCARDPMRCNAKHCTFRDLYVKGAHRKAGGAQGYFFIQNGYNLITGCFMTHLRHFSLQGGGVEYNVVYDNDIEQEISFHSGDDGNNLIENNRITLPADMPPGTSSPKPDYYAIMGAWSIQHENSKDTNYIYKNDIVEHNHKGSPRPWSDPRYVYVGPHEVKPKDPATNFTSLPESKSPNGGTLYPITLGEPIRFSVPGIIEAEDFSSQFGIKTESTNDVGGGENIGFIEHGDWCEYLIEVTEGGDYELEVRAASNTLGGIIKILIDGQSLTAVQISSTGGWQNWKNFTGSLRLPPGKHSLKLSFEGGSGYLFNLNRFEIRKPVITGIGQRPNTSSFIYPNPVSEELNFSNRGLWEIKDLTGHVMKTGNNQAVNISELPNGMYIVIQGSQTWKIIKN